MNAFQLSALFLFLIAGVGWVNSRFFRLPNGVVMVLAGVIGAVSLVILDRVAPTAGRGLVQAVAGLDFPQTVLNYMLGFLLFAGAMQVDFRELRRQSLSVIALATLGVLASTAIVGAGVWLAAKALGFSLPLAWAVVFGALISPTDPIAVLAAVRTGKLSKTLEAVLQGEALFNDGVGIVVFTAAVAIATAGGGVGPTDVALHVLVEALGGLVLGTLAGWLTIRAMSAIDDYAVEVAMSLALATGVYAGAQALHLSGPIAVVVAGLMIGGERASQAMSEITQRYLKAFWTLVDEVLNGLLFLLLGLELVVIGFDFQHVGLWLAAIALVVAARLLVVSPWGPYFRRRNGERGAALVLTWGGLHGALSLALALTLPASEPSRALILSTTYAVVVFSVVVQGLTFPALARRFAKAQASASG
ncbi:MAG: Sodium:proton antiporter [Caulobacteraceae bacterium]|nr:Sodium:proton antiporter [Caulobacteraceae bacterium]